MFQVSGAVFLQPLPSISTVSALPIMSSTISELTAQTPTSAALPKLSPLMSASVWVRLLDQPGNGNAGVGQNSSTHERVVDAAGSLRNCVPAHPLRPVRTAGSSAQIALDLEHAAASAWLRHQEQCQASGRATPSRETSSSSLTAPSVRVVRAAAKPHCMHRRYRRHLSCR